MPNELYRIIDFDQIGEDGELPEPAMQVTDVGMGIRLCATMRQQQNKRFVLVDERGREVKSTTLAPIGLNREQWAAEKRQANQPRESSVVTKIMDFMNSLEFCFCKKRLGGIHSAGEPDIYGCIMGLHFEIEVKQLDEEPRGNQEGWLQIWANTGAMVCVGRRVEDVQNMLERYNIDWRKLQELKADRIQAEKERINAIQ